MQFFRMQKHISLNIHVPAKIHLLVFNSQTTEDRRNKMKERKREGRRQEKQEKTDDKLRNMTTRWIRT